MTCLYLASTSRQSQEARATKFCSISLGPQVRNWCARWRTWVRHCATSLDVAGSFPDGGHWNFSLTSTFRPYYGPEVDSSSNRSEYQEYFLGGKGGRWVGLTTLLPSCTDYLEILGISTFRSSNAQSRPAIG